MSKNFQPDCLPVLIGSLPLKDHNEAARLVFKHTPEIPLWVQLPVYDEEGMINQFMPGFPGLVIENNKSFINSGNDKFSNDLVEFYEEYMAVLESQTDINHSRFAMSDDTAKGFFVFKNHVKQAQKPPFGLKGQITGPITFATSVKDQAGRAVFYDDQTKDAAIKLLALKARWQIRQLAEYKCPIIMFLDEPALAGFGSSEFISISKQDVSACLDEVIEAVHAESGLAGIHVCANTEWDLIMNTSVDIVNFDAYSFFDRFILYPDVIKNFIESGRIIAWGIVPTGDPAHIDKESPESLADMLESQIKTVENLGIERFKILQQSIITPSCGTGSLSLKHAARVLELTQNVSQIIRSRNDM